MEYKAYYELVFESEKTPNTIFFDYVNASEYRMDVQDADFGGDWSQDGLSRRNLYGSFTFYLVDYDDNTMEFPEEPDFEGSQAVFVMLDENSEEIKFKPIECSIRINTPNKTYDFNCEVYEDD